MFEPEEYRIVRRIKDFIKKEEPLGYYYIMLRNEHTLYIDDYRKMVSDGKINPQYAYVYIGVNLATFKIDFYYPFLNKYFGLLFAYLSKLGLYYDAIGVPATGLKYIAVAERYEDYITIELTNLDTVANNTGLRKIVVEVLDDKLISRKKELTAREYKKIRDMYESQRLFAGHNFEEALDIIMKYYDEGNQSHVKEVARIAMDYERVFQPYRFCYDMKTWKEIDCLSIKPD